MMRTKEEQHAYDNPWLCPTLGCHERFPSEEARDEHYKTCEFRLRRQKADKEREERLEQYYRDHPEKQPKYREHPCDAYNRWWLGKMCRCYSSREFKRVVEVRCHGPPSMVYGGVELIFEDGTSDNVSYGEHHRPRKSDVEVQE